MPRKYALTNREIRTVRPTRRIHGALFSVAVLPLPSSAAKVAVVVSKKISAKAVERNKIQRRARAALRSVLPQLPPAGYLFTAKREARTAEYEDVARDIAQLAHKLVQSSA